jgi:predicted aminopeptidase
MRVRLPFPCRRGARAAFVLSGLALVSLLSGCTELRYVAQAGAGQLSMTFGAQTIDDVVGDVSTPLRTRALLREVASIKRFGELQGLTATDNYTRYVDLDRPAAVWVVSACEPLRFRSKTWSFPIVGTVPYLGWFELADARAFAAPLRAAGWDVDVRPAGAYSTLGWLEDPVLSTMIPEGDEALGELANVVLHESLHATLYLKGQTRLNESLANFVGDELAKEYLDARLGATSSEKRAYLAVQERSERRARVLYAAYARLNRLYTSALPEKEKREKKRALLAELTARLGAKRPINNATLVQFRVYNSGASDLRELFGVCGGSWPRFIGALRTLDASAFTSPQDDAVVRPLIRAGCR